MIDDRMKIKFFIVRAEADFKAVESLKNGLIVQMKPSKKYKFSSSDMTDIMLGEDWDQRIKNELNNSHFGLLMISPNFLASDYIKNVELKHYTDNEKPVMPVMLIPVSFEHHDLNGLDKIQIFRLRISSGVYKAYSELKLPHKEKFSQDLYVNIEERLAKM
jgi:hypothetical protein